MSQQEGSAEGSAKRARLNIKVSASTSEAIEALAEPDEINSTEVIRRAVALLKLVDDRRKQGLHLAFVDESGTQQARLEMLF